VYLVGLPGSGKSEVGRMLAERLGIPFVDLDEEIERETGVSVKDIFEREGEPGFRAREKQALSRISARNRAVVACGGGVVIDPDNRAVMRAGGSVVWLDVDPATAAGRVEFGADRPLLGSRDDLDRLAAERRPLYEAAATVRVDAGREAGAVADEIRERLS
jgi:shikimate kinase